MLWHHLLTRDIIEACETTVRYGWEVDSLLESSGVVDRLQVAEVIARAASVHGLHLPAQDVSLLASIRYYAVPRHQWTGGTVLATPTGHAAYALGDGRTVESTGRGLSILREPGTRYVGGYRIPATTHHQ